ncbi:hypothetical protein SARC_01725 [Sphaeroforma arctica JP610]|uniref:Nudix hydrolase domain-containing protein n=1 Tax=Sphaeroforma arctica JP610 TaxID=667725 RepID=A0A0L0GB37_9EUKA|nr:hypothetical protein SARC_01725 [Sphaeroforma arctica JP610]KNC86109.1 hypothetical protein SARC_01725 [Sphaeroforma arctica JP610]|eukprot:XP_014160011.1 hypothetical protein SARC_01725 [Sphaeroforma arctica JP610]
MDERIYRDARGFAYVFHPRLGLLVLRAFKKRKGTHFQIPGGNVDRRDWGPQGTKTLTEAVVTGVTRELFEETGLEFRNTPERVNIVRLSDGSLLAMKDRYYVVIVINDEDTVKPPTGPLSKPLTEAGEDSFRIKLSKEHTGFYFEPDLEKAAEQISLHSGGKNSIALRQLVKAGVFKTGTIN